MTTRIELSHIDHFVLTVSNIEKTCDFYQTVLGVKVEIFAGGRKALTFGNQKINLHESGKEFEPKAAFPKKGSGDFCLISLTPIPEIISHLTRYGVDIEDGPVLRTGATGSITSVYIRDPDQNLVEISNYLPTGL